MRAVRMMQVAIDQIVDMIAVRVGPDLRMAVVGSPAYFQRNPKPKSPHDLTQHNCITIRQGDDAYGTWRLNSPAAESEPIKVRGNLATNDGEIAVNWALDGHGILLRSEWDIAPQLRDGQLVRLLEPWAGTAADIHAIWPPHHQLSARVRAFVDFLAERFADFRPGADESVTGR